MGPVLQLRGRARRWPSGGHNHRNGPPKSPPQPAPPRLIAAKLIRLTRLNLPVDVHGYSLRRWSRAVNQLAGGSSPGTTYAARSPGRMLGRGSVNAGTAGGDHHGLTMVNTGRRGVVKLVRGLILPPPPLSVPLAAPQRFYRRSVLDAAIPYCPMLPLRSAADPQPHYFFSLFFSLARARCLRRTRK